MLAGRNCRLVRIMQAGITVGRRQANARPAGLQSQKDGDDEMD
jgi:hypothetical protein